MICIPAGVTTVEMRAVREATPSVWGVILQFPFYAGIAVVPLVLLVAAMLVLAMWSSGATATRGFSEAAALCRQA